MSGLRRQLAGVRPLVALRKALITGAVIVLPAWLASLLLIQVLVKLGVLVKPISRVLPEGLNHPQVLAALVLVMVCLFVGFLMHSKPGRSLVGLLNDSVFGHLPGYESLRNITKQLAGGPGQEGFKPCLIEVEDGCLAPAFLIENHTGGQSTVFMPSVPTPMAGAIYIMPSARVHTIDVSVPTMMKCITKWGAGSEELLAKHHAAKANQA
jgi:uncharacterized membrane protein